LQAVSATASIKPAKDQDGRYPSLRFATEAMLEDRMISFGARVVLTKTSAPQLV
jgi:hypothetical protein